MSLMDQYRVEASNDGGKTLVGGKWSPIYAQALLVELDTGLRFITNFRYNVKKEISADPLAASEFSKFSEL